MSSDTTTSDHLQMFLEDPSTYNKIIAHFDNDRHCYNNLRDCAKNSLDTFDEYFRFYEIYAKKGSPGVVFSDLKRNASRSLKNMVLGDSSAGRQYPIRTVSEFQRRINKYQDLGVESVTYRNAAFTLLEHIYDKEKHKYHTYHILNDLLSDIPDSPADAIEILVRARFVAVTKTMTTGTEAFDESVDSLLRDLPDPYPDDDRAGSELLKVANKKNYSELEKIDLVRASLLRQFSLDALQEYLYLSARDVVERYRHSSREDPWRGELQLAHWQCICLKNLFAETMSTERQRRTDAYEQLIHGELKSGGRWRSQRDSNELPDPDFIQAARHYMSAANLICRVDANRYIKYLSKSFRNQATAAQKRGLGPAQGWETSYQIHEKAVEIVAPISTSEDDETNSELTETVLGTIASHRFRSHQAAAVVALKNGDPETAIRQVDQAWEHIDAVPTYVGTDLLDAIKKSAKARKYEDDGEFRQALDQYNNVDHPYIQLEKRRTLAEIKLYLYNNEYNEAINKAETSFEHNSPLIIAIQIVAGKSSSSVSIHSSPLEELHGVSPKKKMFFSNLISLSQVYVESQYHNEFTSEIKNILLNL